jgi:hypothetical protein
MQLPQTLPPNAGAQLAQLAASQGTGAGSELQVAYQRVGSLEHQNQQLKDQLAQLQALRAGQNAEPPNVAPVNIPTTVGQTSSTALAPEATALLPPATSGSTIANAVAAAAPNSS